MSVLKKHYKILHDPDRKRYLGLHLNWDYNQQ